MNSAVFAYATQRERILAIWKRSPRVRVPDDDDEDEPPVLAPPAPRRHRNRKPVAPRPVDAVHAVAASQMQRKAPARAPTPPPELAPAVAWPASPAAGADPAALFDEPVVEWPEQAEEAGGDGMVDNAAEDAGGADMVDSAPESAADSTQPDLPSEQSAADEADGMVDDAPEPVGASDAAPHEPPVAAPPRKPRAKRTVVAAEIVLTSPPKRQSALRAEKLLQDIRQREDKERAERLIAHEEKSFDRAMARRDARKQALAESPSPLAALPLPMFSLPPFLPPFLPATDVLSSRAKPFATRLAETMVHEGRRAGHSIMQPLPRRMQRRDQYVPFTDGFGPVPRDVKMWAYFVAECARCHQPPASYADATQRMRILGTHIAVCRMCMDDVTCVKDAPLLLPRYPPHQPPPLIYDADAHPAFVSERTHVGLTEHAPRSALEDVDCLVPYKRNIGAVAADSPLWGYYCAECTRCGKPTDEARYRLLGTPLVVCLSCYADVGDKWLVANGLEPCN